MTEWAWQAKSALKLKGANTTALFDVIMQELGMLKTLTVQVRFSVFSNKAAPPVCLHWQAAFAGLAKTESWQVSVCISPPAVHQSASTSLTFKSWRSGASQPLQKAISLWKKRPGVKALLEFGVLKAEPDCSLHTATIRHDAGQWTLPRYTLPQTGITPDTSQHRQQCSWCVVIVGMS